MNKYLLITIFAVSFLLSHSQLSFAVCTEGPPNTFTCDTNPPNPDPDGVNLSPADPGATVTMLPGSAIDTRGNVEEGIDTTNNNDKITVTEASITSDSDGINSRQGMDIINVTDSVITSASDSIEAGAQAETIMNITGSTLFSITNDTIEAGGRDDVVFISHSTLTTEGGPGSQPIDLDIGDDELTLGTGVVLNGNFEDIDCGTGFDTIIFAMDVPEERLNFFSNQIAQATLPDGSVTIDGLTYNWTSCELLVNELVGVRITRPIPTLSQWGLIALAVAIGAFGVFFAVRRRTVSDA